MDLLSTIRKSGSRGGVNFSWDDVAKSSHRENYLGHSLKAPVGRWQNGKDLNWYSKSGDASTEDAKEQQRKDELRKIKEAEEDAMARALGLPPPVRESSGANAIEVKPRDSDVKKEEDDDKKPVLEIIKKGRHMDDRRDHRQDRSHRRHHDRSRHHDDDDRRIKHTHDSRDRSDRRSHRDRGRDRSRSRDKSAERSSRRHRDRHNDFHSRHRSQSRDRHGNNGPRDRRVRQERERSPNVERHRHRRRSPSVQ
ncbi:hypothetical protein BROUX41_004609 [Berkeleyomyces rouxiae]